MAAELAALGFTGPTQIYEFHDGGVLKAFSDASDPAPLTRDLGKVFHLDATSIKPYSCCGSTHSYVDAALELRRKLGTPWDAKRPVRVGMAKVVDVQCGFDYVPSSALNAQMSLRYVVAAALLGRPGAAAAVQRRKNCRSRADRARRPHPVASTTPPSTSSTRRASRPGSLPRTRASGCAWTCSTRSAPPPIRWTRREWSRNSAASIRICPWTRSRAPSSMSSTVRSNNCLHYFPAHGRDNFSQLDGTRSQGMRA